MPPVIVSVFSYSWSSEKKRVCLRVRPCYLLQLRLPKDERSDHPLAVSFPSSFYSESYTSLQILMRWKSCLTTLCLTSLEKPLTYVFWIERRRRSTVPVRTRELCVGIPRRKSERALNFFFSADWQKSMRAHNEKHRKKTCQALCTYFQDTGVLISSLFGVCTFGVLQPTANFSKNWMGTYFRRGTYLRGFMVIYLNRPYFLRPRKYRRLVSEPTYWPRRSRGQYGERNNQDGIFEAEGNKSLIPGRLASSQLTCPSTRKVRNESVVSLCSERYNASTGSPWPSGPKWFDRLFSTCSRQLADSPGG